MTKVMYLWHGDGEERLVGSLTEVKQLVEERGGSYEMVYDSKLSQVESYCMNGAFSATDRWKNYKY